MITLNINITNANIFMRDEDVNSNVVDNGFKPNNDKPNNDNETCNICLHSERSEHENKKLSFESANTGNGPSSFKQNTYKHDTENRVSGNESGKYGCEEKTVAQIVEIVRKLSSQPIECGNKEQWKLFARAFQLRDSMKGDGRKTLSKELVPTLDCLYKMYKVFKNSKGVHSESK